MQYYTYSKLMFKLRQPDCRLMAHPRGTSAKIRMYLMFLETRIIGLHCAADSMGGSIFVEIFIFGSINLFYFCKSDFSAVQGHPRSLILTAIENAYRTSYQSFMVTLVLSCTDFVLLALPLFHRNLGGVPVAPNRPCWGQCEQVPSVIRP